MCQNCENCQKVRFIKPEAGNRSFCVPASEVSTIEANVERVHGLSTTHKDKTKNCDHPGDFQAKT